MSVPDMESIQMEKSAETGEITTSRDDKVADVPLNFPLRRFCGNTTVGRVSLYLLVISLALVFVSFGLLIGWAVNSQSVETTQPPPLGIRDSVCLKPNIRIIPRREWTAQPPTETESLLTPVPYVIISHSASEECRLKTECLLLVKKIQTYHMESKGWSDITYNFLVGGDGNVYEGRGWTVVGGQTPGYNNVSIAIGVIGTFSNEVPPEHQLRAAKQLIELGVAVGFISENYKLLGHRQLPETDSLGAALYREIMSWPHWNGRVYDQ